MTERPCLVWLPMDHRLLGDHDHKMPYLVLGDKYARAIKVGATAQPVLFPLAAVQQIPDLLAWVDGVMLTGSASNIHPAHFDETVSDPDLPLDAQRDALTLALAKACIAQCVPLLGVCRGFQEINVAMGGRTAPARALGHALDGLVEAFEVAGAGAFAYAVQWHPAWHCLETPFYAAIFKAFGQACRERQSARLLNSEQALSTAIGSTS